MVIVRTPVHNVTCHMLTFGQRTDLLGVSQVTKGRTLDCWATVCVFLIRHYLFPKKEEPLAVTGLDFEGIDGLFDDDEAATLMGMGLFENVIFFFTTATIVNSLSVV